MSQTERPPRPDITVYQGDEGQWEVYIETDTGLTASVKVGYDAGDTGLPVVDIDVFSDDFLVQRRGEGPDFALFNGLPTGDDDDEEVAAE